MAASIVPLGSNFDLGFQSDISRDELNARAAFRMKDWIPQLESPLRKRGGWSLGSPTLSSLGGTAASVASLGFLPFPGDGQVVAISNAGSIYQLKRFDGLGGALITDTGDTSIVPSWPVFWHKTGTTYYGIVLAGLTQTGKVPKKYYDTGGLSYTVAALGGTPPKARFGFSWGDYLVLGNYYDPTDGLLKNYRLAFSGVGNPDLWALSGASASTFDFPEEMLAGVPTLNSILMFGYNDCHIFTGDTPPPGGNMARKILFAGLGTVDGRSCKPWRNYAVWANASGVYQSDGATLTDLTATGGISVYYRQLVQGFSFSQGWSAVADIYRDHYWLSIHNASGTLVTTFCCDLTRKVWSEHTNINAANFAHRAAGPGTALFGGDEELFFAHSSLPYVGKISSLWTPASAFAYDGDGTAVLPVLETPFYRVSSLAEKRIRRLYVGYDLRTNGGAEALSMSYVLTPEPGAAYTTMKTLPVTTAFKRRSVRIARFGLGVGLKFSQTAATVDTRMYSIETDAHPFEATR